MSRTARLFMLMDALRAHRRPVTAARLAAELRVSMRTVYRDIRTLVELGAPVDGEADATLARAAATALAKIGTASPRDLRDKMAETGLWAPPLRKAAEQTAGL